MEYIIKNMVINLRKLQWDQSINSLINEELPYLNDRISNKKDEDLIVFFNNLLNLILSAINNQDAILLCDLLEYELLPMIKEYNLT